MRRTAQPISRRSLIKSFGLAAFLIEPVLRSMAYAAATPFEKAPRYVMFFKGGAFYPARMKPRSINELAGTPVAPRHRLDGTLDGKAVVLLDHAYGTGKVEFMEGSLQTGARQTVVIFLNTGLPDFQAVPKLGLFEQPLGDELMDDFAACGFAEVPLENPELAKRYAASMRPGHEAPEHIHPTYLPQIKARTLQ